MDPINSSSSPDMHTPATALAPSLHAIFGTQQVHAVLVLIMGVRFSVAALGVCFNSALVYVTIRDKSLHGTCNLLIAIEAATNALYQSCHTVSFFLALSGVNFVPLGTCLWLLAYAKIPTSMQACTMLVISADRLLRVLCPILVRRIKTHWYIPLCLLFPITNSSYEFYACWRVATLPQYISMPVTCSMADWYQGSTGQTFFLWGWVLNTCAITSYAMIWVALRWIRRKNPNAHPYTRKIFKSLLALSGLIMFGHLLNSAVRFTLPLLGGHPTPLQMLFLSTALGTMTNLALCLNAPALYWFSTDYRKAFKKTLFGNMSSSQVGAIGVITVQPS